MSTAGDVASSAASGGPPGYPSAVALRPELVADFVACHNLSQEPEGEPFSPLSPSPGCGRKWYSARSRRTPVYRGFIPAPASHRRAELYH